MHHKQCIDLQAEAMVGKMLIVVVELNSRIETCEAEQFKQTCPEADGEKFLAWHTSISTLLVYILFVVRNYDKDRQALVCLCLFV